MVMEEISHGSISDVIGRVALYGENTSHKNMLSVIIQPLGIVLLTYQSGELAWRPGIYIVQITPIKMISIQ